MTAQEALKEIEEKIAAAKQLVAEAKALAEDHGLEIVLDVSDGDLTATTQEWQSSEETWDSSDC